MTSPTPSLQRAVAAELIGTFLLIFFGCGAVHAAVLTGAQSGLWQVAVVWGIAIMLASYTVGSISGAHINPAMTIAMHLWRDFPATRILPYIGAQVTGAMLAAASLFILFSLTSPRKNRPRESLAAHRAVKSQRCVTASIFRVPVRSATVTSPILQSITPS